MRGAWGSVLLGNHARDTDGAAVAFWGEQFLLGRGHQSYFSGVLKSTGTGYKYYDSTLFIWRMHGVE